MKEECYCLDMQLIFWLTFLVVVVVTICYYSQITRTFHLFCHCVTVLAGRLWVSILVVRTICCSLLQIIISKLMNGEF